VAKSKKKSPRKGGPIVVRPQEPSAEPSSFVVTPEMVSSASPKNGLFRVGSDSMDVEISGGLPGFLRIRVRFLRLVRFFGRR
jgi:hypothetical protein